MAAHVAPTHFRFFDNREKYLLFVTTCGEKWAIAERVGRELARLAPAPPALRVFDAGTGDGTVLASLLRRLHVELPTVPFVVVGKEISREDVRMTLAKLPDRLAEHPEMAVAVTNLHYRDAPSLSPSDPAEAADVAWHEVALEGDTAHEFDAQLDGLRGVLERSWRVRTSERTGNPLYLRPAVLVVYRADRRFLLDRIIPRPGRRPDAYDLVVAAQPYRTRQPARRKVSMVLLPLARWLAPGGRMIAVQSTGQDPGMEIIRKVWPREDPFLTPGPLLARELCAQLREAEPAREYRADAHRDALFRYSMHVGPADVAGPLPASVLLAAWNAAVYVAQIDDAQVAEAMQGTAYLEATREVLARHGGLWFTDESFVVQRVA